MAGFVFEDTPALTLDERLDAMLEVPNADDVPFLVAAVRYWRQRAGAAIASRVEATAPPRDTGVACPSCGSVDVDATTQGFMQGRDFNRATCHECRWVGMAFQLVQAPAPPR